MRDAPLSQLLQVALPKPAHLANTDGGPALALSLHCCMVREGYTVLDTAERTRQSVYMPPADWNGRYKDEWIFHYTKDGKSNKFTLHCSLQPQSKRMFIHASEENNLNNVQILGLQLDNYIPEPSRLKGNDWNAVITNEDSLIQLFTQYISIPLGENAEDMVLGNVYISSNPTGLATWYQQPYVVPIAVGVVAVAALVLFYNARR